MAGHALKLYLSKQCPFCHRVEIVAKEKKLSYEAVAVPLDPTPDWYKAINPRAVVPTLEAGDGKYFFESNLIAQYLDSIGSPAGSLMGSTPYQRHRIEFLMSQVGDLIGACYALLGDPFNAEKRKAVEDNASYIDGIYAKNQLTGPYYCDDVFTMADVALLPFLVRQKASLGYYAGLDLFANAPHLKRMWAAGSQRPSVVESGLKAEEYVKGVAPYVPKTVPAAEANGNYIVYGSNICPFVDRVKLACAAKKFAPFWVEVSLSDPPEWFKNVNYLGTVPVLVTPQGDTVYESQLIVQHLDRMLPDQGLQLIPSKDAEKQYEVNLFTEGVSRLNSAFAAVMKLSPTDETMAELVRAAGELEKQMEAHPFGEGPFFGGATMNAADIAVLPILVRLDAFAPDLTGGLDVLAQFPLLSGLLKAGVASGEAKEVFLARDEYLRYFKQRLGKA